MHFDFIFRFEQSEDNDDEGREECLSRSAKDSRAYVVRKRPLYYNCFLLAPDGQQLCVCDVKKAEWYIDKGLAGTVIVHRQKTGRYCYCTCTKAKD